jgi:peroxiredoxin
MVAVLRVGDTAPDFTLPRGVDQTLTLSDLLSTGAVLIHFYVFDFGTI